MSQGCVESFRGREGQGRNVSSVDSESVKAPTVSATTAVPDHGADGQRVSPCHDSGSDQQSVEGPSTAGEGEEPLLQPYVSSHPGQGPAVPRLKEGRRENLLAGLGLETGEWGMGRRRRGPGRPIP